MKKVNDKCYWTLIAISTKKQQQIQYVQKDLEEIWNLELNLFIKKIVAINICSFN